MKAKWENEKSAIGKVQKLREEIEQLNAEIEKAEREYDLNRAAEIKYGRLPELQKELEEEERTAEEQQGAPCCATASPRRRSPRSSPAGPASRSPS